MYLDALLTARTADGMRPCDRGGLIHTGCANIVLVQKTERIVKLSDLPLIGPKKALGSFRKQSTQSLPVRMQGLIPKCNNSVGSGGWITVEGLMPIKVTVKC